MKILPAGAVDGAAHHGARGAGGHARFALDFVVGAAEEEAAGGDGVADWEGDFGAAGGHFGFFRFVCGE